MPITITGNDAGATRTSLGLGDASTKNVGVSNGNVIAADSTGLPSINGSQVTALNASNLGSGTVPTARLGSGTASSSTFLRGDGSWQAAGGGAWTKIATVVADNDATLTITGIAVASFECYALVLSRFQPVNDQADLFIRIGAGGTPATTGYNTQVVYNGTASAPETTAVELTNSVRSSTDGTGVGIAWIHPFLTDSVTAVHGQFYSPSAANVQSIFGGALPTSGDSIDRIQILFDTGNMKYGRATLYGIEGQVA